MKAGNSNRRALAWAGGIVLALVLVVYGVRIADYRVERLDFWAECGSRHYVRQAKFLGPGGPRNPLVHDVEVVKESKACRDYFPATHQHRWEMSWLAIDGGVSMGTRASGRGFNSALRSAYEGNQELRSYVSTGVGKGRATRDGVRKVLAGSSSLAGAAEEGVPE